MDLKEALLLADEIIFSKTGRHLDDLQLGLIEGVLQRKKYSEIAQELKCTEGYLKDIGYELWRLFSEFFQEDVNKSNLRSSLLRHGINNSFNSNKIKHGIIEVNVCGSSKGASVSSPPPALVLSDVIRRLENLGLSQEQIADCLGLELNDFKNSQSSQ